jgi:hypothetical protein
MKSVFRASFFYDEIKEMSRGATILSFMYIRTKKNEEIPKIMNYRKWRRLVLLLRINQTWLSFVFSVKKSQSIVNELKSTRRLHHFYIAQ